MASLVCGLNGRSSIEALIVLGVFDFWVKEVNANGKEVNPKVSM